MFPDWDIEREFQEMFNEFESIMDGDFFSPFMSITFVEYEASPSAPRFPWRFRESDERRPERGEWAPETDDRMPGRSRWRAEREEGGGEAFPANTPPGYTNPFVDVIEEPDGLTITAEMPGLSGLEDISVKVLDRRLQIRGEGEKRRYFTEIPLNSEVSKRGMKKHYRNGILELRFREGKGILEEGSRVLKKVEETVEKTLKEKRPSPRGKSVRKNAKKTARKNEGTESGGGKKGRRVKVN